jgi:hypothetical protein
MGCGVELCKTKGLRLEGDVREYRCEKSRPAAILRFNLNIQTSSHVRARNIAPILPHVLFCLTSHWNHSDFIRHSIKSYPPVKNGSYPPPPLPKQ